MPVLTSNRSTRSPVATRRPLATPSRCASLTSSGSGSVFQTRRPLPASIGVDRRGVVGGDDHQAVVHDRRVQVALRPLPQPAALLPGIGGDPANPARLGVERRHGPQVRLEVDRRAVEGQEAVAEVAGRPDHPHPAHAHHVVVDVRRGLAEVADPARIARLGVEAGDVRRGLLAAIRQGDVHAPGVGHGGPLEPDGPAQALGRPLGEGDRVGRPLPEQLAVRRPIDGDQEALRRHPPSPMPILIPMPIGIELAGPIRA